MSTFRHQFTKEELENSPSRKDGFTADFEARWRRRYCRLIDRAATECEIGHTPLQTAILYLHHYYAIRSMASNDPKIMVTAALYLACKVEEQPRSLSRVTQAVYSNAHSGYTEALKLTMKQETFLIIKQKVLKAERALLYALGFNLEVRHPSLIAVDSLDTQYSLFLPDGMEVSPEQWMKQCRDQEGDAFTLLNQLCALMWHLGSLSFQLPYYLHYNPSHIAAACIYGAMQMMDIKVSPKHGWNWWDLPPFQCPFSTLDELSMLLLGMLNGRKGPVPQLVGKMT